jgi:hypothetical protein
VERFPVEETSASARALKDGGEKANLFISFSLSA